MTIKYFPDLIQGSDEWLQARCGLLTASEMKLIVTPTLEAASNEKERAHLYELLAQRVTHYVEPRYVSDDMMRGHDDEIYARATYVENFGVEVEEVGFITNDRWGFTLGYSPDGLVGDAGLIEIKSRRAKYQIETILENVIADRGETIPADFVIQVQTGLLVSEREWIDFISYSGGLPMATIRVYPDPKIQGAILAAAAAFEARLSVKLAAYYNAVKTNPRLVPTERHIEQEITA